MRGNYRYYEESERLWGTKQVDPFSFTATNGRSFELKMKVSQDGMSIEEMVKKVDSVVRELGGKKELKEEKYRVETSEGEDLRKDIG